jgi:hypothetical protein
MKQIRFQISDLALFVNVSGFTEPIDVGLDIPLTYARPGKDPKNSQMPNVRRLFASRHKEAKSNVPKQDQGQTASSNMGSSKANLVGNPPSHNEGEHLADEYG